MPPNDFTLSAVKKSTEKKLLHFGLDFVTLNIGLIQDEETGFDKKNDIIPFFESIFSEKYEYEKEEIINLSWPHSDKIVNITFVFEKKSRRGSMGRI